MNADLPRPFWFVPRNAFLSMVDLLLCCIGEADMHEHLARCFDEFISRFILQPLSLPKFAVEQ